MKYFIIFRDSSIFWNTNFYGYYLSVCVPLSFIVFVMTDFSRLSKPRQILLVTYRMGTSALLCHSAILTRSLGPMIGIVSGMLFTLAILFLSNRRLFRKSLAIFFFYMLVMAVASIGWWDFKAEFARLFFDVHALDGTAGSDAAEASFSGRGRIWMWTLEYIRMHPWFGCGPDNLVEAYAEIRGKSEILRPHCEVLQYAMELGIPAAACYVLSLLCLFIAFCRKFRYFRPKDFIPYPAAFSYFVQSFAGNPHYYTTCYFIIMLGFIWRISYDTGPKKINEMNPV